MWLCPRSNFACYCNISIGFICLLYKAKMCSGTDLVNDVANTVTSFIYYFGKGRTPDVEKAIFWLRTAASKGGHAASVNLANIYYEIGNTKQNNELAWAYYTTAASLDRRDYFYLGRMLYEERIDLDTVKQQVEEQVGKAEFFFHDSLCAGRAESAIYIWKMYRDADVDLADAYFRDGEMLLRTPKEYNNFAWELFRVGEAEKAIPYIEKCMSLMSEQGIEVPAYLDTYGEVLYALGRKDESEQAFRKCLHLYMERDERRRIADTLDKMQQKFGGCEMCV